METLKLEAHRPKRPDPKIIHEEELEKSNWVVSMAGGIRDSHKRKINKKTVDIILLVTFRGYFEVSL